MAVRYAVKSAVSALCILCFLMANIGMAAICSWLPVVTCKMDFASKNNQETSRFNANIGTDLSNEFTSRIYISHTHADAEIPGAISLAETENDPTKANTNNVSGDYQRNLDITRLGDKSVWEEGDDRIETTLFYTYRTLDNPVTTYEIQANNDVGMLAKYIHQYGQSQWLIGINNYYGDADEIRYHNIGGNEGSHILSRDLYASTSEAYGQVEQHLTGGLYGIASIQGSYSMRDIEQSYPTTATQDEHYAGYNPRIGLRYDINEQDQLFTNLSRSFEPPTWSELSGGNNPGFNDLKAQKATTAEIGGRGSYDNIHWEAAYYHAWVRNEFVNYEFTNGDTATINAPRTKKDGIELGLNGDAYKDIFTQDDSITLRAAYTLSHFTLDHDPLYGNNTLPGVP